MKIDWSSIDNFSKSVSILAHEYADTILDPSRENNKWKPEEFFINEVYYVESRELRKLIEHVFIEGFKASVEP